MKKFLYLFLLFLLPATAGAQDARQRSLETIVADGLAQLPAENTQSLNAVMQELAATGARGVEMMAGMLVPAAEGKNATVEYALSGVVNYATAKGQEAQLEGIRMGLEKALDACTDKTNQAFLLSLLQLCSTEEQIPLFVRYADDEYLADAAIRALIQTPSSESAILSLMQNREGGEPSALLAYAASKRPSEGAEDILLAWLADYETDNATKEAIYNALAACGTSKSLKTLAEAAEASDYGFLPCDATSAYLRLLGRLAVDGNRKALSTAKSLLRSDRPNIRTTALDIVLRADAAKRTQYLLAALKDDNREYRCAALHLADCFADEALYAAVAGKASSLDNTARTDIVNWLGSRHAVSQSGMVIASMASENEELALAAIRAAGKIGGTEALEALIAQLDGPYGAQAEAAIAAFNGNANDALIAALDASPATQARALGLVAARRNVKAADKVFTLLNAESAEVRDAAHRALAGVTSPSDFDRLCDLLDKASDDRVAALQDGLKNALAGVEADEQYRLVAGRMEASADAPRYYPLLAQAATRQAIDALLAASDREAAFKALLTLDNPEMIGVLYNLAREHPAWKDAAISRFADFVAAAPADKQVEYYRQGLEAEPSEAVQNKLLTALADTRSLPAVEIAAHYLDNRATAVSAAYAVKSIAAKNPGMGGETVVAALEKAREVYIDWSKTDPDAGYAVDEIKGLLAKYAAVPRFELSPEEAAEGFEVLFDGLSLEKWTGNKTNYVPVDGTIYVTAQYGGSGNLYTIKEYGDFVLRFEFAFDREGVNNGIGIRTPMGVDAAYHGMEIQVLDHDAPIYKDLHVYQQHGSVYGVIPAKRVKFPPLGTWNVEEIRAVGDRITVTVNGEVILDGNIRQACKGHNVAPDGSSKNPYTVDHRNHPGLFNKRGHIGLLGHGPGIKFRNIRIKELPTK